jgi:microsomal epoxide hydrolase
MRPTPLTAHVPDEVLDDRRARLARTRWPEPLPPPGWTSGGDLAYLRDLVGCWPSSFVELLKLAPPDRPGGARR